MPRPWHWLVLLFVGCLLFCGQQLASTGRGALVMVATGGSLMCLALWRLVIARRALARWLLGMPTEEEGATTEAAALLAGAQGEEEQEDPPEPWSDPVQGELPPGLPPLLGMGVQPA